MSLYCLIYVNRLRLYHKTIYSSFYVCVMQYAANLGMEMQFQFYDVFGLDPDLLTMVPKPCIALLLLFPINEKVCNIIYMSHHYHHRHRLHHQ